MTWRHAVAAAGLLALLSGCTKDGERATATTTTPTNPAPCTAGDARAIVLRFFEAYNQGRVSVDEFFAPAPTFQWYSDGTTRVTSRAADPLFDPYNRASLAGYFTQRHGEGDRLELVELTPTAVENSGTVPRVSFAIVVRRPSGTMQGKAVLDCASTRLFVWSLGGPPP